MQFFWGPWLAVGVVLSFLLPNHYDPWRSFHQEALAFLAFVPLSVVAVRAAHVNWRVALGVGVLLLSPLLQFVFGQIHFVGDALVHAYYMAAVAVILLAGCEQGLAPAEDTATASVLDYLLSALLIASIASVGLMYHQWLELGFSGLFINDLPPGGRPFGNLAQPNHQSLLLALGLVVLWRLWELERIGQAGAWVGVCWLLSGMVLTDSRAFYLGGTAFFLIFLMLRKACRLRTSYGALLAALGCFVLMVHAKDALYEALLLAGDGGPDGPRVQSVMARAVVWKLLWQAILDKPLLGYGWGMVASAQLEYAALAPEVRELFFNAHNWLIDLMIQLGIPVTLAVLSLGLYWFQRAARQCNHVNAMAALLVPVLVLAYSAVEFQYTYAYFLLPAAYCAGLTLAGDRTRTAFPTTHLAAGASWRSAIAFMVALTWGLGALIAVDYWKFESIWQRERFVMARIDPEGVRPPFDPYVLTQLQGLLELERAEPNHALNAMGLDKVAAIASRYPYIPLVMKWAVASKQSGQAAYAQQLIDRVCLREGRQRCRQIRESYERF